MDTFITEEMCDDISACTSIDELKDKILPILKTQREQWAAKINNIISASGYTKTEFAKEIGISRQTVNAWCNGAIPKSRERFIQIGLAAMYSEEKMNRLLQRFGGYPELYSKSLSDCVCLFVLKNSYGRGAVKMYHEIIERIKTKITADDSVESLSTVKMSEKLSDVGSESEMEQFINENSSAFATAYHRFYAYVMAHISANYNYECSNIWSMSSVQGWSESLRQSVYAINRHKWYPDRKDIISLGLHLSMDHEQIDKMLELARMEPLCAKNILECVIIYILEDASRQGMLTDEVRFYEPDYLCTSARNILSDLDIPELKPFLSEVREVDDYER
jgi:DNA-binding XRE family transcriptional regulator